MMNRPDTSNDDIVQRLWTWLLRPPVTGPRATMVIRLMAGSVFFWEGLLKFVYENQGVGRFTKLGIPFPLATAPFVGGLEIVGGLLLMVGLGTRLIAIPFIIEMVVAMISTKPRLFLGTLPLAPPPVPPQVGMWAVLHEIRSEYAQIMTCIFLLISGPGPWSLDAALRSGEARSGEEQSLEMDRADRERSLRGAARSQAVMREMESEPRRSTGR